MRRVPVRRRVAEMATWYPLTLLLHLSCAIVFIGAVAFEVLVLESLHRQFEHDIMARIEAAVMARARRFMPFVVALLFLSGFALFDIRGRSDARRVGKECVRPCISRWLLLT